MVSFVYKLEIQKIIKDDLQQRFREHLLGGSGDDLEALQVANNLVLDILGIQVEPFCLPQLSFVVSFNNIEFEIDEVERMQIIANAQQNELLFVFFGDIGAIYKVLERITLFQVQISFVLDQISDRPHIFLAVSNKNTGCFTEWSIVIVYRVVDIGLILDQKLCHFIRSNCNIKRSQSVRQSIHTRFLFDEKFSEIE